MEAPHPISFQELVTTQALAENEVVEIVNNFITSHSSQLLGGFEIYLPCSVFPLRHLEVAKKYFNKRTGWKLKTENQSVYRNACDNCRVYHDYVILSVYKPSILDKFFS